MTRENSEVTAAGIARLAGVGRAAVSNWRRRYDDFPRPVGGTDTSPTFALAEIEQWLRDQGKLAEVPPRERLWQLAESHEAGPADALIRAGEQLLGDHPAPPDTPLGRATAALAADIGPAATFDFLLGRHLDAARQLALTPPETAELMAALAGPATSVLDPACGPGTLLAAAQTRHHPAELHGQDADPTLARIAALRLALHGTARIHIAPGDTLRADAFPALTADAVLCHPPFNERHWGHDELTYDPRWEYGLPARTESELAWVQHALARLRPGGTAVLLMPPAAASRRTGRRVRDALLRRGALRAVIALPAGAAPPHSLPLHLWILRKPATTPGTAPGPGPRLLVVDTATVHRAAGRAALDWPALHDTVHTAWTAFDHDGDLPERSGVHRVIPAIDLLDDEVDLAPARHLPPAAPTSGTAALAAVQRDLRTTLRRTHDLAPRPSRADADPPRWSTITVGELARAGALALHTHPAPAPRPGDVLVRLLLDAAPDGPTPPARVVTDHDAGTPPDRHTALLRPDPEALDPWFLAGFLRGTANTRQASSYASAATRLDPRRLKVPRLPLDTQRRYGDRFRDLDAFETALRQATDLGRRLLQGTIDALTTGVLPPRPPGKPSGKDDAPDRPGEP